MICYYDYYYHYLTFVVFFSEIFVPTEMYIPFIKLGVILEVQIDLSETIETTLRETTRKRTVLTSKEDGKKQTRVWKIYSRTSGSCSFLLSHTLLYLRHDTCI